PEGIVSRWQMALFLTRGLGLTGTPAPNTYVSKAKTLDATGALSGTVLTANGAGAASYQSLPLANTAWLLGGNAGTNPATQFLGTTDPVSLTLRVSNAAALRLVPASHPSLGASPNLIGGHETNSVTAGVAGAVIGGGGILGQPNRIAGEGR